jgi:protein arginine kinase activator
MMLPLKKRSDGIRIFNITHQVCFYLIKIEVETVEIFLIMPDRPLDCSECKKPIYVCYTEIVGDKMTRTVMCKDCPHLEKRLYGKARIEGISESKGESALACGNCGVSLEAIRMGNPLGCSACYGVFSDALIDLLLKEGRISRHLTSNKKTQPLHIGRTPGEVTEISPTLRLIALNEALDETLVREDYEQAALLRDQIRALKEKGENEERTQ